MKMLLVGTVAACLCAFPAYAQTNAPPPDAKTLLQRVLENRPTKDFTLKARLFPTRDQSVPIELLIKNTAEETRTIYRAEKLEVLVIQPLQGQARWFLKGKGELTGKQRLELLLGSYFSYYDLALPFLHWPDAKTLSIERTRGRDCFLVEVTSSGEPYSRVQLWIDKEFYGLLRAEAFDENGSLVKRFAITSFKKVGEVMVPKGTEVSFVPPGQSLPAQEKSRLDVYEGEYDQKFPSELFSPDRFGAVDAKPNP